MRIPLNLANEQGHETQGDELLPVQCREGASGR